MISLKIHRKTTYRFTKPMALGPHRLMLRPHENRDLRVISSHVTVTPEAVVTWAHDVFGNAVATATFQTMTDNLVIDSVTELPLDAAAWPVFSIAASAIVYPFRYSDDEWTDLGALTRQQYPDPMGRLRDWARAFVRGQSTDTLSLLKDLSGSAARQSPLPRSKMTQLYGPAVCCKSDVSDGGVWSCASEPPSKTARGESTAGPSHSETLANRSTACAYTRNPVTFGVLVG